MTRVVQPIRRPLLVAIESGPMSTLERAIDRLADVSALTPEEIREAFYAVALVRPLSLTEVGTELVRSHPWGVAPRAVLIGRDAGRALEISKTRPWLNWFRAGPQGRMRPVALIPHPSNSWWSDATNRVLAGEFIVAAAAMADAADRIADLETRRSSVEDRTRGGRSLGDQRGYGKPGLRER